MSFLLVNYVISVLFSFTSIVDKPLLLSPFISSGDIHKARNLSFVHDPDGILSHSHAGFITVDERAGSHLFFWFFPSVPKNRVKPLLIWLNGGPGGSSMFGLFYENGPVRIDNEGKFVRWEKSWTKHFSMLYIDNPVGVGFSYSEIGAEGFVNSSAGYATHLYVFIKQFYKLFPEYRNRPLYVGGQSYAGKYVSEFAYHLHSQIEAGKSKVPLTGIYIGGAYYDPPSHQMGIVEFYYSMGGYSFAQLSEHKKNCHSDNFLEMKETFLNSESCAPIDLSYNYLKNEPLDFDNFRDMMNSPKVKKKVHAGDRTFTPFSNMVRVKLLDDIPQSSKSKMAVLMDNYKVLLYSGDMDGVTTVAGLEQALMSTPWSLQAEYNDTDRLIWYSGKKDVVGYYSQTGKLCRVVIRNAGHHVPFDQPDVSVSMMQQFVRFGCVTDMK